MNTNFQTKTSILISLLLAFFYSTLITVHQRNFFYIIPVLFLLLSIPYCISFFHNRLSFPPLTQISTVFLSHVAIFFTMAFFHDDDLSTLKTTFIIALLFIPSLILFYQVHISLKNLSLIFAFVTIIFGIVALYDKFYLELPRALIERQPIIPAGSIAMTMGLFCLNMVFFFQAQQKKKPQLILFLFVGALLAILCSILTGSRGTWLPLPFILIGLVWVYLRQNKHKMWWLPVGLCLFIIVLAAFPQTGIQKRVQAAQNDMHTCLRYAQCDSSLGHRLQMWKSALLGIEKKPWLGWGEREKFYALKAEQAKQKQIIPTVVEYTHAHNYFLDIFVKKGLLAFLAALAIVLFPFYLFWQTYRNKPSPEQKCICEMGMILTVSTFIYCLSDVFIGLQLGMVFYCVTLALLMGVLFSIKDV